MTSVETLQHAFEQLDHAFRTFSSTFKHEILNCSSTLANLQSSLRSAQIPQQIPLTMCRSCQKVSPKARSRRQSTSQTHKGLLLSDWVPPTQQARGIALNFARRRRRPVSPQTNPSERKCCSAARVMFTSSPLAHRSSTAASRSPSPAKRPKSPSAAKPPQPPITQLETTLSSSLPQAEETATSDPIPAMLHTWASADIESQEMVDIPPYDLPLTELQLDGDPAALYMLDTSIGDAMGLDTQIQQGSVSVEIINAQLHGGGVLPPNNRGVSADDHVAWSDDVTRNNVLMPPQLDVSASFFSRSPLGRPPMSPRPGKSPTTQSVTHSHPAAAT